MRKIYCLIVLLFVTLGAFTQTIGPLLKDIAWDQEAPYYNQCPLKDGKRTFVGCGATAAGQVMRFYKYPKNGVGTITVNDGVKVDLAKANYNWDQMLPTYQRDALGTPEQKTEVARLLRHVGAAMNMDYSLDGSGSSLLQIRNGLKKFSYKGTSNIIYRIAYTDDEWFEVLKREIDAGRPIPFTGMNAGNGSHLFVCDGYELPSKKLHFNYGWDGRFSEWATMAKSMFFKDNSALIGVHPTSSTINPTLVMFSAINFSNYTPKIGGKINVAVRIANYGLLDFNNAVGVALYKGSERIRVLKEVNQSLTATLPVPQDQTPPKTYDILFTDVPVPTGIAAGDYQLRIVAKSTAGEWCPVQGLAKTVVKEANVEITTTGWDISYPLGEQQVNLELTTPIEINVANNRAVARFSIRNTDAEYDLTNGDLFVVTSPNNKLIPATWKRITADIQRDLIENFEVSNIEVPVGADVKSCRFSVVYNRIYPKLSGSDKEGEIAVTCVPILPAKYNFKEYQMPNETTSFFVDFTKATGKPIPADYKMYYEDGREDLERKTWGQPSSFLGYATAVGPGNVRLVTSAISVRDENEVLEWRFDNMSSLACTYRIYISTEGQDYKYFENLEPAYDEVLPAAAIARFSLSEYAGKKVYIMFQTVFKGAQNYLDYFKVLNIKSPKDIALQNVNIPGSITSGESFPVKFTVKNNAAINVKKVIATYTVAGSEPVREEIVTNIPFDVSKELTFSKLVNVNNQAGGMTKVTVRIEQAGEVGTALENNEGSAQCMTINFYPKKSLIVFKSSKSGCPACKTSYTTIDDIDKLFPEASTGVEVWRDGSFKSLDFADYAGGATPAFFLNAKFIPDYTPSGVPAAARRLYNTLSPVAEISVQADYENATSRKLKIRIKSRFATPLTGTYHMGAFIIESNVRNIDGQISGATPPSGEKLTKNHIPVGTVGGCKGITGKKIINPELNEYIYECEFPVPEETYKNKISYRNRRDNVQVVGVLFDSNGNIINTSLSSYYIRIPKTEGLTFVAETGYTPFKQTYDVESTGKDVFVSEENYRSTILAGNSFKFRINKDVSWNGKELRLVANPTAVYNFDGSVTKEQVLFPDENGVYTLDNVNMHYYMRVDKIEAGERMLTKKGSQLVMSGNWSYDNFNKLNISSPSLTGIDMTGITIPEGVSKLNSTNPNMLIYTAANATVPASWENVVKGTNADNIALKDGYPFYNSKEFTASSVTYTREYPSLGWASGCLPFAVSVLPESIQAERFSGSQGTIVNFEPVSSLETNTPYIYKVITTGEKVFAATNATIPITNLAKVTKGEYSFNGTFDKMSGADVAGLYMLSHDGSGFKKANATNNIPAYRSFIEYTGINKAPLLTVEHETGGGETGLDYTYNKELVIRSINNIVEIIAPKAQQANLYALDGRLIRILTLNEGVNTVYGLTKGLYIINNQKIAVR